MTQHRRIDYYKGMKPRTRKTYSLTAEAEGIITAYAESEDMSQSMWLSRLLAKWHRQRSAAGSKALAPAADGGSAQRAAPTRNVLAQAEAPPAEYVEVEVTERDVGKTAWMSARDAGV